MGKSAGFGVPKCKAGAHVVHGAPVLPGYGDCGGYGIFTRSGIIVKHLYVEATIENGERN